MLVVLYVPAGAVFGSVLFFEDFLGTEVDSATWEFPTGPASNYGRTQIRPGYPPIIDGKLHLKLNTYNPTSTIPSGSFFGSDIFTRSTFLLGQGLRVELKARLDRPIVRGLVGGLFLYQYFEQTERHSEIDFELLTNFPSQVQTNVYWNEGLGAGHSQFVIPPGLDLAKFNVYRIDWLPNSVRWYINDVLVRTELSVIPRENLEIHLNFWGPACSGWTVACGPDLQPAQTEAEDQEYDFLVDWVRVSRIPDCAACSPSRVGRRATTK